MNLLSNPQIQLELAYKDVDPVGNGHPRSVLPILNLLFSTSANSGTEQSFADLKCHIKSTISSSNEYTSDLLKDQPVFTIADKNTEFPGS